MSDPPIAERLADGLRLAATPVFTVMTVLAVTRDDPANLLCGAVGGFWLDGMAPMYGLMSLFHAAPWLRLISGEGQRRRRPARTSS